MPKKTDRHCQRLVFSGQRRQVDPLDVAGGAVPTVNFNSLVTPVRGTVGAAPRT